MDLYYLPRSAPCRAVVMTAKALGVELNKKLLNTSAGDQLRPEYLKINPQHTIPTIVDVDGFILWESRAIMIYLVERYGKDDALYPKCPKKQALINQRLYFDMDCLTKSYAEYFYPQFFRQQPADPEKFKNIEKSLQLLDTFLEGNTYVTGDSYTLADISVLATICNYIVADVDITKYTNVNRWFEHMKTVTAGWSENWDGCLERKKLFKVPKL